MMLIFELLRQFANVCVQICDFFNSVPILLLYIIKFISIGFLFIFIQIIFMKRKVFILFLIMAAMTVCAQNNFEFETDKKKIVLPFKLINNLIFIPIEVNGVELNFLLDTGVEETILLSLEDNEKVKFNNVQKIKLKGLGSDEPIEGLKSTNNFLNLKGFADHQHELYIVLDQNFNFSAHIGIPVNGIIGYHFFKNNLIEIDYAHKKLIIHRDGKKVRKKMASKFYEMPITIEKNKPYLMTEVMISEEQITTKVLLDIGNSDAIWLFPNLKKEISIPEKNFSDYLGKGFSGDIHGNRAKGIKLKIGKFFFDNPIIAFPDSTSIKSVNMVKNRDGSIGGEIFKRFDLIFNYAENKMYLKKNGNFKTPFHYNMSGIEIQNEGLQWVKEEVYIKTTLSNNLGSDEKNDFKYKFSLKPVYMIASVRKNSAADVVGLKKGDIITKINGFPGFGFTLDKINDILKSDVGKWITFEVDRNGITHTFRFQLKDIL